MILRQTKLLGIVFLALLLACVYLTYAVFTKKFAEYDEVTLRTSHIGLQLPQRADVKIRGVIVGEVLDAEVTADGAELTLGLHPGERETIPANVTGSIVPKTLFGEKYVSLEVPARPAKEPIRPAAVIERTEVATEVEEVLADLYPLLRTVQPAQLNATLNALATALEGRGDQVGQTLETLDAYLTRLNPQIPALIEDLRLTAEVSDIYTDVLPEVAEILQDTITTTGTLEERESEVTRLFTEVTAFSGTARTFLADNGDNLIRLGEVSKDFVGLLAKYSPGFPCLINGIVGAGERQAEAFRGYTLHIVLELLPNQPRPYTAEDAPRFGEDRGPTCLRLPDSPGSQDNPLRSQPNMDDGVDEPTGKGTMRAPTGFGGDGVSGTLEEDALLRELLGAATATPTEDVDDLGVLLLAPMARGAEVTLR
ncbi:MCE family protein [Nocardioides sp. zg-DK7169]|uniref:MCE family protein n=1 Tax=Nocardioides sp. zg-DK7169 TaxID=2736600 RepID=UPI00155590A3|nr:MCE family protein [Nocardioides sp. zg-DK7169]NPC98490.1 MCE family protein [Nocardioides sp. zg-DK7169]